MTESLNLPYRPQPRIKSQLCFASQVTQPNRGTNEGYPFASFDVQFVTPGLGVLSSEQTLLSAPDSQHFVMEVKSVSSAFAVPSGQTSGQLYCNGLIALIREQTILEDPYRIEAFLIERPWLQDFVLESTQKVYLYFGPDALIYLRLLDDPDSPRRPKLFALVRSPLPFETALSRLAKLDNDWLLDVIDRARGGFAIDVEFG